MTIRTPNTQDIDEDGPTELDLAYFYLANAAARIEALENALREIAEKDHLHVTREIARAALDQKDST